MIKAAKVALLVLFLSAAASAQSVVWTWTNAPQNASLATCPTTSPVSCMAYYELDNITIPTAPVVITKTILPTAATYTQSSGISYGNMMVSLTLYYYDQNGVQQKTSADTDSLLVMFSAQSATALTGTQH